MSTTSSNKENDRSGSKISRKSKDRCSDFSRNDSDSSGRSNSTDSDSDWDLEPVLVKRKKIRRESSEGNKDGDSDYSKETLPLSAPSSPLESSETSSPCSSREGSESPTPEGQWEIECIINYVKDDFGDLYFVKWKNWDSEFNTWEPKSNLLNCEDELLRFYKERKKQLEEALENSEYVEMPNGKRRRKGPKLPDVPPDPRPFDLRVEEFLKATGSVSRPSTKEIHKVVSQWQKSRSRWPDSKVDKALEDGTNGQLTTSEIKALKEELILIEVETQKKKLATELKEWEYTINKITERKPTVTVENNFDLMGPPKDFEFVKDYIAGEGVEIPKNPPVGCNCGEGQTSCYDERSKNCCAVQSGYKFAYTKYKKVNVLQGSPIYECNSKCNCPPDCSNRVVQDGTSEHKLCIFRTSNGRGWGVKTLKSIKKGAFVTLYVGEVIKSAEAERRGKIYDETGFTYLFDLDFNDPDNYPYSVDASKYGNIAHFINHSCSPNLCVYAVWTDCLDPNLPKLAMFALRDIARDEELTFDYNVQLSSESRSKTIEEDEDDVKDETCLRRRTLCLCGTPKCRKFIF